MFLNNYCYIDISTSISSALAICVLFISLMQSVNGAQFLNITFLLLLFGFTAAGGGTGTIDVVPLKSHKRDFSIEVSNLILLLVLCIPRE